MKKWVEAGHLSSIELDDVIRFDYGDRSFAIYRTEDGQVNATDGFCTHGHVHLEGGLVMGHLIECPKHNGRFNFTTGEAIRKPACIKLKTYPAKISENTIYIEIDY